MRVLSMAFLEGHRSMNPCPVYDAFTGELFLFFIAVLGHTTEAHQLATGKNAARLCYVSSDDYGETWSPAVDLTEKVIGDTIKGEVSGAVLTPNLRKPRKQRPSILPQTQTCFFSSVFRISPEYPTFSQVCSPCPWSYLLRNIESLYYDLKTRHLSMFHFIWQQIKDHNLE